LILKSKTLARQFAVTTTTIRTAAPCSPRRGPAAIQELEESLMATLSAATSAALERARHVPAFSRGRSAGSYELAHRAASALDSEPALQGVDDFCAALGAAERRIRRSFNSFFGMGPARLAKLHRLNRVRRMLVEGTPDEVKVMKVLSACDVTEFGRFAGEYKAIFGEKPSDTLKRSVAVGTPGVMRGATSRRGRR
jgi:methylphosphotriester-DNA--protein-cysteine methyltransferase